MHKAILQTCFSTSWGGLEMVALELAVRMQANGITVVTACTANSPLAERLKKANLETLHVHRRGSKYLSPTTTLRLRRALQSGRFSAVLVEQMNELWQVVPALWGMREIKLVGISHTLVGVNKKNGLHSRLYARFDNLVALTEIHRRNLLENLPIREPQIVVIPNAVDLRLFHPGLRSEKLRAEFLRAPPELLLGVVSRIDKGKGLLEVVDAAQTLKKNGVAFRMIIAGRETIGEEGMAKILEADINARGLKDHVFLVGHRPDIGAVMASLDLLIMPSPGETFGRVLIEAMAAGVAVVASHGGGVADIVRDGVDGLLVPPTDPVALAKAVERCCRDSELRQRLRQGGLAAARERYDQKNIDHQLYKLMGIDT